MLKVALLVGDKNIRESASINLMRRKLSQKMLSSSLRLPS